MIIWNNFEIKINSKTLYYNEWHEKGSLYLNDLNMYSTLDLVNSSILTTCNFSIKYLIVIIKIFTISK